ncbi:sugar diacid recognition domain-containing protein [Glutamicibacter halophytocola]|uniref:sugar diacid recognition domain-containing protein n=1 Tax=Glutamicibacter halophytocola TaxID=1933880 RepID=UPI00321A381F
MSEKEQPRLSGALAQKVVDTIAPTINRHVNIMNAHGIIIASSDASRVGTLHEGSVEAIRRNEAIRVTQADETAGTQPGVNLPLALNERLCGVVGVTGAPHEVEPLADLIALTVQLLFAQEREHSRGRSPGGRGAGPYFGVAGRAGCRRSRRPEPGSARAARADAT